MPIDPEEIFATTVAARGGQSAAYYNGLAALLGFVTAVTNLGNHRSVVVTVVDPATLMPWTIAQLLMVQWSLLIPQSETVAK